MQKLFQFVLNLFLVFAISLYAIAYHPAIASASIYKTDIKTNTLASIEGYPRLEMALDRYLMAIPSGYYTIANVAELKSLIADRQALIVDVREPSEYQSGHIPNAINIPLRTISRNLSKIPSDHPVILYCSTGYRSSMGVMTLHLLNYDNVMGFPSSLAGWKQAGGAITFK